MENPVAILQALHQNVPGHAAFPAVHHHPLLKVHVVLAASKAPVLVAFHSVQVVPKAVQVKCLVVFLAALLHGVVNQPAFHAAVHLLLL